MDFTVSGVYPDRTSHGNWHCPYCEHPKAYKSYGAAEAHIVKYHKTEAELAEHEKVEQQLRDANERLTKRLEEALKKPPKPEKVERYSAVVYCPNCMTVDAVSVPKGYGVGESSCFRCNTKGGMLVTAVNADRTYK